MSDRTLTWKRSIQERRDGEPAQWVATDEEAAIRTVYVVRRDPDAPHERQWTLRVLTGTPPDTVKQTRTGFHTKAVAQEAALGTRCHVCFRVLPFATLEASGRDGWRCRDHEDCAAAEAEREDEQRRIHREIRNTDLEDIAVRDPEDGPELLLVRAGTGNQITIECTENDLARLRAVLARRAGCTVEYTVIQVSPLGGEDPLSGGHFVVGQNQGGVVFHPDEETARTAAIEYARKLHDENFPGHFIVRRTATEIIWDGMP